MQTVLCLDVVDLYSHFRGPFFLHPPTGPYVLVDVFFLVDVISVDVYFHLDVFSRGPIFRGPFFRTPPTDATVRTMIMCMRKRFVATSFLWLLQMHVYIW